MTTNNITTTTTTRRTLTAPEPVLDCYGQPQTLTVAQTHTPRAIRLAAHRRRNILALERARGGKMYQLTSEAYMIRIQQHRATLRNAPPTTGAKNWLAALYQTSPRNWRTPVMQRAGALVFPAGECVGVEIEHLIRAGAEPFATIPVSGVRLVGDGSVSTNYTVDGQRRQTPNAALNPNGQEAVMMFRRSRPDRLIALCDWLDDAGATVNQTCGLHVHLDMRDVTRREALTRARRIAAALPWLITIVPPSRRNNDYCRPQMSSRTRYVAVNCMALDEHNTIEIRLAAGSVDAQKILMWIDLMLYLSRTPKRMATLEKFLASTAPLELKLWVVSRRNKFNPPSGSTPEGSEQ